MNLPFFSSEQSAKRYFALGVALSAVVRASVATAALIQVDSSLGSFDANSCTLVNAFAAAAAGLPSGTCPAGDGNDVIELQENSAITLTGSSLPYGDSLLAPVKHTLLLVGNDSTVSSEYSSCDELSPAHRLMSVWPDATFYVNSLTLTHGCATDSYGGGAIQTLGSLDLENVTFIDNSSTWDGGAISAGGYFLQISDSSFIGNNAGLDGGAVDARSPHTTVTRSSFSQNVASHGGALSAWGPAFRVINSTFSRNLAGVGGAIQAGTGSISFSTFMGNDSTNGGAAIHSDNATVANSIFAKSPGGQPGRTYNCDTSFGGSLVFVLSNLSDDPSCGDSVVVASQSALAFGAAGAYGGTTQTLPLGAGSVAIGAATTCHDADGAPVTTDQRGHPRNPNAPCDAGAFEHDANSYPVLTLAPFGAGNLLLSHGSSVSEYTRTGVPVRNFWPPLLPPLPDPMKAVDADGLTGFGVFFGGYNGNAFGLYALASDLWVKTTYPDWTNYNGASANKLAHVGHRWFLTTVVGNAEAGIIVADDGVEVGRLYPNGAISDLKVGLDGLLYVLLDSSVQIFDPHALMSTGIVDLSVSADGHSYRSIAVDTGGEMFVYRSDGVIAKLGSNGDLLKSTNCVLPGNIVPCDNINEIALSQDHVLFLASHVSGTTSYSATITSVDDTLSSASSFPIELGDWDGISEIVVSPVLPDPLFGNGFDP